MAASSSVSMLLASTLTVLLFAGMQMYKTQLASSEWMTVLGGFLGSNLFILILTAVNNFEYVAFGRGFQARLFPEVVACLVLAMFASSLVHRVCVTTCAIFSIVALYYINKISSTKYAPPVTATPQQSSKKRK
ncbi:dolichyl-diphosphooligosaccharide--protein glycosyltransferase subunit KCP2-like isoform X2 [Glandiceps talaboti]